MYTYPLTTIRERLLNQLKNAPQRSGQEHALQYVTTILDTAESCRASLVNEISIDKGAHQEAVMSNWTDKQWRKEHVAVYNEVLAALRKTV